MASVACRTEHFHTGLQKDAQLAPDELIRAVCLHRRFAEYVSYARKVGARNAQAISKVCIAALGRLENGVVLDVRIALGSVAPVPLRLSETERVLDRAAPLIRRLVAAGEKDCGGGDPAD